MVKKPKLAVAFDLEGTCVDLEAQHFLAFERTMTEFGCRITVGEIEALPGAIGGGDPHIAAQLAELVDTPAEVILQNTMRHFDAIVADTPLAPRIGLEDVIERIKSRGHLVGIGSLTPRTRGERILERSRLGELFKSEYVVFREDVERVKPNPDVYLETARRMGVSPDFQVVFEDSVPGVKAAVAARAHSTIAVPAMIFQEEGWHIQALHEAGASKVCKGWNNVYSMLHQFSL